MNEIAELIINDVCLDERISDGIFDIQNAEHMTVLREYLINKGIPVEEVVNLNNKMLEGKYPERQAYNKDGILVTFPTPKHKAKAIARGTHFEKNPNPQQADTSDASDTSDEPPVSTSGEEGESESPSNVPETPDPSMMFVTDPETNKQMDVEPIGGNAASGGDFPPIETPEVDSQKMTPLRKAAEKEVIQQMIDNPEEFEFGAPVTDLYRESLINELYKLKEYAKENKLKGAYTFISKIIS